MKEIRLRKLNNKGLSLVEVLVALAIASIVATLIMSLVTSGSRFYRKQSNSIDLQNELQETSNKVADALMEATELYVSEQSGMLVIKTGDFSGTSKVKPKCIIWVKPHDDVNGMVYVMDTDAPLSMDDAYDGYCMSKYVSDFSLKIDDSCLKLDDDGNIVYDALGNKIYEQPIVLNVSIKVSNDNESKQDSKTITLRNRIMALDYMGKKLNVSSK